MTSAALRYASIAALLVLLAACTGPAASTGDQPAAGAPAAAQPAADAEPPPPPMEKHEASAECWMKYDKSGGSLEAKAKLVNKCIDEKMKPAAAVAAAKPKS